MTIRSKRILEMFAVCISVASYPTFAHAQASSASDANAVTPNVVSTVTTTGGTANKVAKFSGATTIVDSIVTDTGTAVGINTATPTATLTVGGTMAVNGNSTYNGQLILPASGTATATTKFASQFVKFNTSAFNSATQSVVPPRFQLEAEVTGNNTASPNATLNLLASATSTAPTETGFFINTNGTIHFAPGQTFPGGGPMCIAVSGGFGGGGGGATFIGPDFGVPANGGCAPWAGFTKTASTVVLATTGSACLSSTGKTLTLNVSSADPDFFGVGNNPYDYIQLTRASATGTFTGGMDQGNFAGAANQVTCTASLLTLPDTHD